MPIVQLADSWIARRRTRRRSPGPRRGCRKLEAASARVESLQLFRPIASRCRIGLGQDTIGKGDLAKAFGVAVQHRANPLDLDHHAQQKHRAADQVDRRGSGWEHNPGIKDKDIFCNNDSLIANVPAVRRLTS
ncbi:hypothetical protein [Paracoccus mutanolyticus]|uniref:hypothetical protein n=1 Tax=Paracoccus mutanolyticus TaxID=1499308 RepID=UPI00167205E5|nr:hypothetical protein [Paracoccus mutanolyticus]